MSEPILMDGHQAAEVMGMTYQRVNELGRTGIIPSVTVGKFRMYRRADLEAWVDRVASGALVVPRAPRGRQPKAPTVLPLADARRRLKVRP